MKRLFGNQNSSSNNVTATAQASEINTVSANKRPTSPSEATSLAGSTTTIQRAPLYSRASNSFSNQALQTPALLSPHTPTASNVNPFELFPPSSLALSPINSRSSSNQFTPLTSSTSFLGTSPLAAVQNIAPQYTGTTAQPGTLAVLADSNASLTNMQAHSIERNDLHKSVKALEAILVSLDEYRDLRTRLAKCEKKLSKGLNEMAKVKSIEEVPSQTLQAASDLFDARMEVSSKQSKIVQKEYDALNDQCAKYFKRIAKEERTHDEQLEMLDSKIKKTQASYDKSAKKGGKLAIESHDKFIANMQSLTAEMAKLKTSHSSSVGTKTFTTSLLVAATLGGLADTEYKGVCEIVRKSGQHIGKLNEWLNFTTNEAIAKSQPIDLSEDGSGIAQRIAIKEGEIREEIRRQEQIRLRQLEDEHAMLKLQQLGWTPPTNVTEESPTKAEAKDGKSTITMANLPRLDSNGNLVDGQKTKKSLETSHAESAASDNEIQNTRTPSLAGRASEAKRMSSVRSNTYESHHLQGSSIAEGTVIIRDAEPTEKKEEDEIPTRMQTVKEESDSIAENEGNNCPPSPNESSNVHSSLSSNMSASVSTAATSKGSSEDSNALLPDSKSAGPLTPIDEKPDDVIVHGVDEKGGNEWQTDEKEESGLLKEQNEYINRVTSPSNADQSRGKNESSMAGIGTRFANQKNTENTFSSSPTSEPKEHREEQVSSRSSLWERERDRERQMELERRLVEAENRLRMMGTATTNRQSSYDQHSYYRETAESNRVNSRPRYSEPVTKPSSSASRPTRLDEEIPASRYEPDRYAPAVGGSRIEGPSVTRSLSTDSERSFVARMKALYQADKMQQPLSQDTRRRDNNPAPTSPRRVPEIVHAYSSNTTTRNGTNPTTSSSNPRGSTYGHYDSATAPLSKSRVRYDSAPTQIRSEKENNRIDEFGRHDYNTQSRNRPETSNEPPHASSCGCWNCSARHYRSNDTTNGASISMATTKAGILPPQPPPRHPEAITQNRENGYNNQNPPPPNYRRQTMQVPPSGNTYPSNTARSVSGTPTNLMRPEQSLQARRSFEDEHSRHVNFIREHGTVR